MKAIVRRATLIAAAFSVLGVAQAEPAARAASEGAANACVDAYETAQDDRIRGSLLSARERAEACATASCPAFVRNDCAKWRREIDAEIPSVVFEARSDGVRISEVRVLDSERVLAERIGGPALEMDPGNHWFRFEAPGMQPVTRDVVIARGEKNRLIEVELPPIAAPSRAAREPEPSPSASNTLPLVLVGTGFAGVAAFALLGSAGLSEERELERTCAPKCGEDALAGVKTKYVLADVSLAVGLGGLLAGGYLLLTNDAPPPMTARAFPVRVQAGPSSGFARVSGEF